jgi:hypothetical protein
MRQRSGRDEQVEMCREEALAQASEDCQGSVISDQEAILQKLHRLKSVLQTVSGSALEGGRYTKQEHLTRHNPRARCNTGTWGTRQHGEEKNDPKNRPEGRPLQSWHRQKSVLPKKCLKVIPDI